MTRRPTPARQLLFLRSVSVRWIRPWRADLTGEIWTASRGKHYAGKPRPVLVVQDDRFDATDSISAH